MPEKKDSRPNLAKEAQAKPESDFLESGFNLFFPKISKEEYFEKNNKDSNLSFSNLNPSQNLKLEQEYGDYSGIRNILFGKIRRLDLADNDRLTYFNNAVSIASSLSVFGNELVPGDVLEIITKIDSLEKIKFYKVFAMDWRERFMVGLDKHDGKKRGEDFKNIIDTLEKSDELNEKTKEDKSALLDSYLDIYSFLYSTVDGAESKEVDSKFARNAIRVGAITNNPEQVAKLLKIYKKNYKTKNKFVLNVLQEAASKYAIHHELTEDSIKGFGESIFPALLHHEKDLDIIFRTGNTWSTKDGEFGIADFLIHSYTTQITPQSLNELMHIEREIPGTNLARLDKNRNDAVVLAGIFGNLRNFIHDQRPRVHELISAMVDYSETKNPFVLSNLLSQLDYFQKPYQKDVILRLTNYKKEVSAKGKDEKIKVIDVLKSLEKNTKPVSIEPPETLDKKLNDLLGQVFEAKKSTVVDDKILSNTFNYVNEKLSDMIKHKKIGISPSFALALSWIERAGFEKLQSIRFEEQQTMFKKEWFKSILKFQHLTATCGSFDEVEFEEFVDVVNSCSKSSDAYRLIGQRVLGQVAQLSRAYKSKGIEETSFLWSGNIANELMELTELRPAVTEQGRKQREEERIRLMNPYYHPGD